MCLTYSVSQLFPIFSALFPHTCLSMYVVWLPYYKRHSGRSSIIITYIATIAIEIYNWYNLLYGGICTSNSHCQSFAIDLICSLIFTRFTTLLNVPRYIAHVHCFDVWTECWMVLTICNWKLFQTLFMITFTKKRYSRRIYKKNQMNSTDVGTTSYPFVSIKQHIPLRLRLHLY